jgi:hypothetical protein
VATLDSLSIDVTRDSSYLEVAIAVGAVQIDNQLDGAAHVVLMCPFTRDDGAPHLRFEMRAMHTVDEASRHFDNISFFMKVRGGACQTASRPPGA